MKIQNGEIKFYENNENSIIDHYLGMSMNQMRHLQICRIIKDKNISSLIDYGCSQGQFIQKMARSQDMKLLIGLDIQQKALASTILNTYPENIQTSIQYRRAVDQHIYIFQGDVTKKYEKLKEFNVQIITLIQLIQHLPLQDVPKAMKNVFGFMRPKYCFISTPNRQFNAFFNKNQNSFRHWDHKFEWNRQEFNEFCQNIEYQFGYTYQIKGVGKNPSDETRGFCTQYALFTRGQYPIQEPQQIISDQNPPQLIEKAHYTNLSWKNNMEDIILMTLYRCLYQKNEATFQQVIQFIRDHQIGDCLTDSNKNIDLNFIKSYLDIFSDKFQVNEQIIRIKHMENLSQQQFNCDIEIHEEFSNFNCYQSQRLPAIDNCIQDENEKEERKHQQNENYV